MTVRDETAETPGEVRDAKNNERHVCGRRRDGEAAVSSARGDARARSIVQNADVDGRTARGRTSATFVRASEKVSWLEPPNGEPARLAL